MSDASQEPKPPQIQIELDEIVAQGIYANLVIITHTEAEFTLDFIYVQPQQPKARVRSRIIISPTNTRRLFLVLQENIKSYENIFGPIEISREPTTPIHIGGYL